MSCRWMIPAILAVAGAAAANGRAPAASSINFRPGHDADILVGLTFGAVYSHDGGATWTWTCEDAMGYPGGTWDPQFVYTASGKIFANTPNGLRLNTDGCTFDLASDHFVTAETLAPNGDVFAGIDDSVITTADCIAHDCNGIARSTDDGATFSMMTPANMPGEKDDQWTSVAVAPSDSGRVYATNYTYVADQSPDGGTVLAIGLWRSEDHGATFQPMGKGGLTISQISSKPVIAGVSPTDPDVVFLAVPYARDRIGDVIYRSIDAGATWTSVLDNGDAMPATIARANGDLVVGTPGDGVFVATDCMTKAGACTAWTHTTAGTPHINCFRENAAHELWACTANYGSPGVSPDNFGVMKTTDYATWTGVLHYQDIAGPAPCAAGSVQATACTGSTAGSGSATGLWCGVRRQLGITADPTACPIVSGDLDDTGTTMIKPPGKAGCCSTGGGGAGSVVMALGVGMLVVRRRRPGRMR